MKLTDRLKGGKHVITSHENAGAETHLATKAYQEVKTRVHFQIIDKLDPLGNCIF